MSNQGHVSAALSVVSVMVSVREALQDWKVLRWETPETFRDEASLLRLAALWAALQRQAGGASNPEVLEIEAILRLEQERLAESVLEFKTEEWLEAGTSLVAHQERLETDEEYLWGDEGNKDGHEKYYPLCLAKLAELDNTLLSLHTARTFCGDLPVFNAVEDELEKCVEFVAANQQAFYNGFVWAQETVAQFGTLSPDLARASRVVVAVAAHGEELMRQEREGPVGLWIAWLVKRR